MPLAIPPSSLNISLGHISITIIDTFFLITKGRDSELKKKRKNETTEYLNYTSPLYIYIRKRVEIFLYFFLAHVFIGLF